MLVIVLLWTLYENRKKKRQPKNFAQYMDRIGMYERSRRDPEQKKKIEALLLTGLEDPNLSPLERGSMALNLGSRYQDAGNFQQAVHYYDIAMDIGRSHKFPYNPHLSQVVQGYVQAGEKEKAWELYRDLLSRQSYDKKFAKLEKKLGEWMRING